MRLFSVLLWGFGIVSVFFLFVGIFVYGIYILWVLFCKQDCVVCVIFINFEVVCELVIVDLSDEQYEGFSIDSEIDVEIDDLIEVVLYSDESVISSVESY